MNRRLQPLCGIGKLLARGGPRAGAASIVAAAWLIAAVPAAASTLTVDYGKASISYQAAAGENNKFSIAALGAGGALIQDRGVAEVPLAELGDSLCLLLEPWKYKCPVVGLATASVDLGDGSDTFDGSSSSLAATVTAGAGPKTISTGAGNDRIFARNGGADQISCGGGDDGVVADAQDVVAADCEHITYDDASGSTGSAGSDTATSGSTATAGDAAGVGGVAGGDTDAFQSPLGLTLPGQPVTMPRPDTALVHLACAATAIGGCRGDIVLELPVASRAHHKGAKAIAARGHYLAQQRQRRRIGTRRFRLAAGQKAALPVRVMFRGHYTAVEKRRRKRVVLKIAERDAAGKVVDVQTRFVTLKLSNKRSPARRHK